MLLAGRSNRLLFGGVHGRGCHCAGILLLNHQLIMVLVVMVVVAGCVMLLDG